MAAAAAAEQRSAHPLAAAIRAEAAERGLTLSPASDFRERYGDGVEARVDGGRVRVGGAAFTGAEPNRAAIPGVAEVWVAIEGRAPGVIRCSDPLRADAAEVVARVQSAGARPMLLTGDSPSVASAVASATGIADVHAQATPEDKARGRGRAAAQGRRRRHGGRRPERRTRARRGRRRGRSRRDGQHDLLGCSRRSGAGRRSRPGGRGDRDRPRHARPSRALASSSAWA